MDKTSWVWPGLAGLKAPPKQSIQCDTLELLLQCDLDCASQFLFVRSKLGWQLHLITLCATRFCWPKSTHTIEWRCINVAYRDKVGQYFSNKSCYLSLRCSHEVHSWAKDPSLSAREWLYNDIPAPPCYVCKRVMRRLRKWRWKLFVATKLFFELENIPE